MFARIIGAALSLGLLGLGALPAPAQPARVELPIRQVVMPDGVPRYTIPITVGGSPVEAMLDSGSTGLRILPGTLPEGSFTPTPKADVYSYGSGAEYRGVIALAPMEIGGLKSAEPATFQAIQTFGCMAPKPGCPVSKVRPEKYGIGGNGISGAGFRAIIGVNMADAPAKNPFYSVGARSWIIRLPKLGERTPGKLILNPAPEETAGFTRFRIQQRFAGSPGGLHDAIWGCLTHRRAKTELCGPFLLDTGGNDVSVVVAQGASSTPWGPNVAVDVRLGDERRQPMTATFTTGRSVPERMPFRPSQGQPNTRINAGPLPYFWFDAFYDPAAKTVGLKPR
jgi:hypothetical protein